MDCFSQIDTVLPERSVAHVDDTPGAGFHIRVVTMVVGRIERGSDLNTLRTAYPETVVIKSNDHPSKILDYAINLSRIVVSRSFESTCTCSNSLHKVRAGMSDLVKTAFLAVVAS